MATSAIDPMDAWMNRYRAFAEGVVIMVCPVLLAIALKKVDLKSEEHGRAVPTTMLVVATVTLVAGICPFLVCCRFAKRFFNGSSLSSPHTVTMLLAPLSSTCLVALACWIIYLILHSWAFPVIGALIGLCSVIRTVTHFTTAARERNAATAMGCEEEYDCNKMESSLDFLAGITALLFLGLEGLALEGQINSTKAIIHDRLTKPIGTSFIVCVVCVGLMLLETMPPRKLIRNLTETIDIFTGFAVCSAMFFIMYALMKLRALLLLVAPFLILMMYVFYAATSKDKGNNNHRGASANGDEESPVISCSADGDKPASLELTKVTFTGFLAVSIPSISNGSVNMSTECFLHLAATAVVSGLIWRLLTHYKSQTTIATIADIASFCTHLCVAVAVIPFTLMAGKALS
ncbi:hypothetical protein BDA96_03G166700 [Sorghum bicolor]|uniref:Uncharacterized protein n=2 Tax=Sorghum bicolor TaxID=4558 RepID=A0A1B6Q3F2_SORBI|nr:uncharacterized protein LOC8086337 [Sorghum bicolor]KAG0537648.1 hypothetical protein BDA96_03G166700 [Sorghum bicolor]KXG32456.1 hypothetical protein SORBI_3003G157600 [Sorghum bicolor]|eukprot:XP_002457796.2 uncharacterized protein LOC8086337 [Sorghum bicolor]